MCFTSAVTFLYFLKFSSPFSGENYKSPRKIRNILRKGSAAPHKS